MRQSNVEITGLLCPRSAVGELEERREDVAGLDALIGEMAVLVHLAGDEDVGADARAHALEQIAFAIVIALCDPGAVQAEDHGVDRCRGLELTQDFIAQMLVGAPLDQRAGLRPGRGAFDQCQPLIARATAQSDHWRRA